MTTTITTKTTTAHTATTTTTVYHLTIEHVHVTNTCNESHSSVPLHITTHNMFNLSTKYLYNLLVLYTYPRSLVCFAFDQASDAELRAVSNLHDFVFTFDGFHEKARENDTKELDESNSKSNASNQKHVLLHKLD